MGRGGMLGAPGPPAAPPGGGGNGGNALLEPGRTGGGKGKLPGGGGAPVAEGPPGPLTPGRAGNPGGGMPPGNGGGKGMPAGGKAPPPGWFWGSIGLLWAWPSAAYEEVMESMTDWAFSWPISAGSTNVSATQQGARGRGSGEIERW